MEAFDGFILAAGMGTRMGPLSKCLPKPAWPLRDRPLLQWAAQSLNEAGLTHLACNAHHLPDHLQSAAGGLLEVFFEPHLLGSAGGLRHVLGRAREPLAVWNADAIAEVPWRTLLGAHRTLHAQLTWLLVPHPGGPWNPVWLDARGRVLPPGETGEGPYHFTGAACWSLDALVQLPLGPSDTKKDLLPLLKAHHGVLVPSFPWREVGTPDQLIAAAAALAPEHEGRLAGNYLHASARAPAAQLSRCVLGPGVRLAPGTHDQDAFWWIQDGELRRASL